MVQQAQQQKAPTTANGSGPYVPPTLTKKRPKPQVPKETWAEHRAKQAKIPGHKKDGQYSTQTRLQNELEPVQGQLGGPDLMVNDNPESFRSEGVLGSSLGMPTRGGDALKHDFVHQARLFQLSNNRIEDDFNRKVDVHNALVIKNLHPDKVVTFSIVGVSYSSGVTKTAGDIRHNYKQDGEFQGPQAIVASSYLDKKPDANGFVNKQVKIGPGQTEVVDDLLQKFGCEIFRFVTVTTDIADAKFGMATVALEAEIVKMKPEKRKATLDQIGAGKMAAAGRTEAELADFAPAGKNELGRPNGIVEGGANFTGGRPISLKAGDKVGDLVMATRFRNTKPGDPKAPVDTGKLTHVPKNPETKGNAAVLNEGNYGVEYDLKYALSSKDQEPLDVEVYFTAPAANDAERKKAEARAQGKETEGYHSANPDGGTLTIPVEVNGKRVPVRVDVRGEGQLLHTVKLDGKTPQTVDVHFVNVGNISPPAGIEFRAKKGGTGAAMKPVKVHGHGHK